ncbi:hypothetical protein DT73_14570 [Mangrovibacter sp. MFB070]|nr:hypothetical protein DT73_14570 [Mangrovibacter sp. MFB070]
MDKHTENIQETAKPVSCYVAPLVKSLPARNKLWKGIAHVRCKANVAWRCPSGGTDGNEGDDNGCCI